MNIEIAGKDDLNRIVEIYNWAVVNTTATFDTETKTSDDQEMWFEEHIGRFPITVIKNNNVIMGWGSLSEWSDRCAYSGTAEISFYIHPDFHNQGVGTLVFKDLIERGRSFNFRTLLSRVTEESASSLYLHKKMGFREIGLMKSVGEKFDRILDVYLLQYLYEENL